MNIEQKLAQAEKLLNEVKESMDKLDITGPCILKDLTGKNSVVVIGKYDPTPVILSYYSGAFHVTVSKRQDMDYFRDKKRFRRLTDEEAKCLGNSFGFALGFVK